VVRQGGGGAVDEPEWLACQEPNPMLAALKNGASSRKLRLFACACARRLRGKLANERNRRALTVAEAFADGLATREALCAATDAELPVFRATQPSTAYDTTDARRAASSIVDAVARATCWGADFDYNQYVSALFMKDTERATQADLLRDIFGNPFRPLLPRVFPPHVVGLALACYAAFPAICPDFAILADALEELCEEQAAAHCRAALHVKGCHVLDWILAKG
jgi:hypothetical protein